MTPDPRTEEIRARLAAARPMQLFTGTIPPGLWLDGDSVAYLLDRIEALEGVADAARKLVTRIETEGGHGYTVHDLAAATRAALDALDGDHA